MISLIATAPAHKSTFVTLVQFSYNVTVNESAAPDVGQQAKKCGEKSMSI